MNIKQFLLDNYIWILVVLLLLIITIIGFLADKKRGSKKKQDAESNQTGPMPLNNDVPQAPINYQPTPEQQQMVNPTNANAQMPINQNMNLGNNGFNPNQNNPVDFGTVPNMPVTPMNINNNVPNNDLNMMNPLNNQVTEPMPLNEPINSIKGPFEQNDNNQLNGFTQPMENNMNQFTNPQPTENLNQMVNQNSEPMYQPLEEQKPTFAPKEVNIPSINDINNIQPQSMNNAFDNAMNQSQPSMINNQNMNIIERKKTPQFPKTFLGWKM